MQRELYFDGSLQPTRYPLVTELMSGKFTILVSAIKCFMIQKYSESKKIVDE